MQTYAFKIKNKGFCYLPEHGRIFDIKPHLIDIINSKEPHYMRRRFFMLKNMHNQLRIKNFCDSKNPDSQDYGLFLNVANTCNMNCVYCFAKEGTYGNPPSLMRKDIAVAGIDLILEDISADKKISIIFFGGEPLLSWDVVRSVWEHCKNRHKHRMDNLKFHIVTNGSGLNPEIIDYLSLNSISVTVSIDGGKEIQDLQRPLKNGKSSYRQVVKQLPYLFSRIPAASARGTYFDFSRSLEDIYQDLFDLGFAYVEVCPDLLSIEEEQIPVLCDQIRTLGEQVVKITHEKGYVAHGLFADRLRHIYSDRPRSTIGCGAGNTIFSFSPEGSFFPCHRFSCVPDQKLGDLISGIKRKGFSIDRTASCFSCWNRYLCPSSCHYNNQTINKNPSIPLKAWCAYSKAVSETSIRILSNLEQHKLCDYL